MADRGPASAPRDPFENLISLVAGPIAAGIRSFDQVRHGSDELIKGLESFNRTMQNLNDTAERVNRLLDEFEAPIRTILPQVLRTANLAEDVANRVSAPIDQVVPGLLRLADTLNSPVIKSLPTDLGRFVEAINDLVRRLAPLGQLAESAGGLFGLRIPGVSRTSPTPMLEPAEPPVSPPPPPATARHKSAAKKRVAPPAKKRVAAKKQAAPRKRATPQKRATPKKH